MLLTQILATFDQELARLHRLKTIIADLGRPVLTAAPNFTTSEPKPPIQAEPLLPAITRLQPRKRPERRAKVKAPTETRIPSPLSAKFPLGPVVISPKQLAAERIRGVLAFKEHIPTAREGATGTFGAMVQAAEKQFG